MAFDGMFLRQIVKQLQPVISSRVNKIYLISDTEVLFNLKGQQRYQLMVSCHSSYNRIHLTDREYPTRSTPSNFIMVMRKYVEGGPILSIDQAGLDRSLIITVGNRKEIGGIHATRGKQRCRVFAKRRDPILGVLLARTVFGIERGIFHCALPCDPTLDVKQRRLRGTASKINSK